MKTFFKYLWSILMNSYDIYMWKKYLKHRKEIHEGIKNYIIKEKNIEFISRYRYKICRECENYSDSGEFCIVSGTEPCCKLCGCSLLLKTYSMSSSCPIHKWNEIIDEETELMANIIN